MNSEHPPGLPILIRYFVGSDSDNEFREMAIFVDDLDEAKDFVHMSLRWAVKTTGGDNGAAELFHVHTNEKLGRMAVLFDECRNEGITHEQWTWVSPNASPLH